jgi:hypothetical protein
MTSLLQGFELIRLTNLPDSSNEAEMTFLIRLTNLLPPVSDSSNEAETSKADSSNENVYRYSHRHSRSTVYLSSRHVSLIRESTSPFTY